LLYMTFAPTAALSTLHIGGLVERLVIVVRDIWYAALGWLFFTRSTAGGHAPVQPAHKRLLPS
jgi:hypothetical protein